MKPDKIDYQPSVAPCQVYTEMSLFDHNTGKEIAHFIPCRRKSDGKTGLYDEISKSFIASENLCKGACS